MADRPLPVPLPADLPEDWDREQIIAPEGADAGLSEQHGYNYLMAAVNRAQKAINAINESFDNISGKRTCRVVVGTSAAGWTEADCDFLCDGVDDQEEINAAANGGGLVVLLSGSYNLTGPINMNYAVLQGNGVGNTTLNVRSEVYMDENSVAITVLYGLRDITINSFSSEAKPGDVLIKTWGNSCAICNVNFFSDSKETCIYISGVKLFVSGCEFATPTGYVLYSERSNVNLLFHNNFIYMGGTIHISNAETINAPNVSIVGNVGLVSFNIVLDGISGSSIVASNIIQKLELLNSAGERYLSCGCLVSGNTFQRLGEPKTVIKLGENTKYNFITGNELTSALDGRQYLVEDNGTNNIVRFNSNDTSSGGGGGTAGVSSFKGRSGAVAPQTGDYTAAMVGAIPTGSVAAIQDLTQAEYDALPTKNDGTLYLIKE